MPIVATGKAVLETSIKQAFISAKNAGAETGADPDAIVSKLAADIASAVDAYTTSCIVTINPGQAVTGIAGAYPVIATVVTPGTS
jgi:hypothetical protein